MSCKRNLASLCAVTRSIELVACRVLMDQASMMRTCSEESFCQCPTELGLTNTCWTQEEQRRYGSIWVIQARTRPLNGLGHGCHLQPNAQQIHTATFLDSIHRKEHRGGIRQSIISPSTPM